MKKKLQVVYLLEHSYKIDEDRDEVKTIGIFSTKRRTQAVIEELKKVKGFRRKKKGFIISKICLDKYGWEEGLVTVWS